MATMQPGVPPFASSGTHRPELHVYYKIYKTNESKVSCIPAHTAVQSRRTFTFPVSNPAAIDYVQESPDLAFVEKDTRLGLGGTSGLRCLEREPYELRLGWRDRPRIGGGEVMESTRCGAGGGGVSARKLWFLDMWDELDELVLCCFLSPELMG